jgi:ribosomal protein S18 acetylase RimI-like enzyme
MTIEIVPICAEHIPGFRDVLDSVARERRYLAFLEAPSLETVGAFVSANIAASAPQFIAISNGQVVGWCDILPKNRPTRRHTGVLGVGVIDKCRGQGIGRALITKTMEAARTKGFTRIELTVRADNFRAICWYERLGFTTEGVVRRDLLIDDQYQDSLLMALLFDSA